MLNQIDIADTIRNAKFHADTMLGKINELQRNGNDTTIQWRKFIIYTKWIEILERYLQFNFDQNGVISDPAVECLSVAQATDVLAKLKFVIGSAKYSVSDWILAFGVWNDDGKWRDDETWNDSIVWS